MTRTLEQRSRDDLELLITAHAVGDPARYSLLRDRTLDTDREAVRKTEAELIALPNEIDMATKD